MNKKKAFSLIELSIAALLIGILIAGVLQATSIINTTRLNSARAVTKSSPVWTIDNLFLWIDSTSENSFDSGVSNNNDAVTTWYDLNPQSPVKNNFTQATAAKKPLYKTNLINGLPAVSFDGIQNDTSTSDSLQTVSNIDFAEFSPNGTSTIFMVFKIYSNSNMANSYQIILKYAPTGTLYNLNHSPTALRLYYPSFSYSITGGTSLLDKPAKIATVLLQTAAGMAIYLNGTAYASGSGAATTITSNAGIILAGSGAYVGKIDVGELIIFSRLLTTDEKTSVESYLSKKWKIKI